MASNILARLAVLLTGDNSGLNKSLSQSNKELSAFSKAASDIQRQLTGALGAISFALVARQILDVTSQFKKFQAVLTNTLGSSSAAQEALDNIRDFASKTPFSVQELTSSFVKLANQGFQPTTVELRKLGDLTSSTAKSFDQLTEAIIDAQTGEFERLKEFGIRASKQGDQVKFTFKGVETQTKFTADSIRDYILSLGELEGVSGSMAAISETLGGKISNLGDSFDNLLLTLGNASSGPAADFIDFLNSALQGATDALTDDKVFTRLDSVKDLYVETANSQEEIIANLEKLNRLQATETKNYEDATAALGDFKTQLSLTPEEFARLGSEQQAAKEFTDAYRTAIELLTEKLTVLNAKTVEQTPLIKQIQDQIKHFEELKNAAFDAESIGRFNVKIKELKDQLDVLNATGFESGFLKNLTPGQTIEEPTNVAPTNIFPTTLPVPNADAVIAANATIQSSYERSGKAMEDWGTAARLAHDAVIAKQVQAAETAQQYGDAIGNSLGQALSGQKTFAQAMKQLTGDLIKMFLQRALAGIISSAATSGGPPPVAIALAAAGVAAISAMFAKIGGGGGGNVGGGAGVRASSNVSRMSPTGSLEERIVIGGEFKLQNNVLVAAVAQETRRTERTG